MAAFAAKSGAFLEVGKIPQNYRYIKRWFIWFLNFANKLKKGPPQETLFYT